MAVTVFSMRDPGLTILPTHRVADAPGNLSPAGLVDALSGTFDAAPVGMDELVGIASEVEGPPTVGFAAAGLDSPVRLTLADSSAMKAAAPERSPAWRRTDVAVLHELILRPHLDLSPERILRKEGIDFVKDASAAAREALSSAGRWAFVIRATTMDQMRHIAGHGELMPQKSTYFYPKLTTGLVMRAMDI